MVSGLLPTLTDAAPNLGTGTRRSESCRDYSQSNPTKSSAVGNSGLGSVMRGETTDRGQVRTLR